MTAAWPARYRDRNGEVETAILNDGATLRMTLRGVEFQGRQFDDFKPVDGVDPARTASFTFHEGILCSCAIEVLIPVHVVADGVESVTDLELTLMFGEFDPKDGCFRSELSISVKAGDRKFVSPLREAHVEGALEELRKQLGPSAHLRCCHTCAKAAYSPMGSGMFGEVACFRDYKDDFRGLNSKAGIFSLWTRKTGFVQETHLCPEWELRKRETGYLG